MITGAIRRVLRGALMKAGMVNPWQSWYWRRMLTSKPRAFTKSTSPPENPGLPRNGRRGRPASPKGTNSSIMGTASGIS